MRGSKVVTWDIGGNDMRHVREAYKNGSCDAVCMDDSVAAIKANWNGIIAEILALRDETAGTMAKTIIRTMNLYNPYVIERQGLRLRRRRNERFRRASALLQRGERAHRTHGEQRRHPLRRRRARL